MVAPADARERSAVWSAVEMAPAFDLITMGRSSIDLYSNDIGAPFEEISSFAALVGGSPLNIAVGASRLGLRTSLLTAVGDDKVGDFIRRSSNAKTWTRRPFPARRRHARARCCSASNRPTGSRSCFTGTMQRTSSWT